MARNQATKILNSSHLLLKIIFTTKQVYGLFSPSIGSYAYLMSASLVMLVILVLAEFTYRLVEVPGISLGRKLIVRRKMI